MSKVLPRLGSRMQGILVWEDACRGEGVTRKEHLDWCKERALELCDQGDTKQAILSMISDLGKHPETYAHCGIEMGMSLMRSGNLSRDCEVREFIEGFN